MREHEIEKLRSAMQTVTFAELPDDLRVPLHELQADIRYLIGRVQIDGSTGGMVVEAILNKLSQIETAAYRLANPTPTPQETQ